MKKRRIILHLPDEMSDEMKDIFVEHLRNTESGFGRDVYRMCAYKKVDVEVVYE